MIIIAALLLKLDAYKTGLIFYSIMNFQTWISILTDLFSMEPDYADLRPKWNKIAKRLRAEKDNRDWLAHNIVVHSNPVSQPSPTDFRSKSRAFKPLTLEQVMTFRERVAKITDDMGVLEDEMHRRFTAAHASLLEKLPSPNPDQSPSDAQ